MLNCEKWQFCYVYADSVEDGEKLIQTALDAFGRIGVYKPSMEILRPLVLIPVTTGYEMIIKWLSAMSLQLFTDFNITYFTFSPQMLL